MMLENISFDFGSLTKSLQLVIDGRGTLPPPAEVQRTEGTDVGVTAAFRHQVAETASMMSALVKTIGDELLATQDVIRKTIEDMVEADASLADEARVVLAALDEIAGASQHTSATPGSPSATSAATGVTRTW